MLYGLDCEFNGFGGELLSLALSGEAGELYLCRTEEEIAALTIHPWVAENVLPVIEVARAKPRRLPLTGFGRAIQSFLANDTAPVIAADWPEDIAHFMRCLLTRPGHMVTLPDLNLRLVTGGFEPIALEGGVDHNALWDARLLRISLDYATRTPGYPSGAPAQ